MITTKTFCPNHQGCKITVDADFLLDQKLRASYIHNFCQNGEEAWSNCKRFIVKQTWHICPDFVMPDSHHSPDEIIQRFESELNN